MPSREVIEQGVDKILYDAVGDDEGIITQRILAYLHSQGVVIKVERELPSIADVQTADNLVKVMLKTGFTAFEPLIKQEGNGN